MTEYLDPEDVDELIADKGFHYRDRGGLLSALAAPMPVFGEEVHEGIHRKAAVLFTAINHNHPLLDGNKRLSWYLTAVFYDFNGYTPTANPDEGDRFVRTVAGENPPSLSEVQQWFEEHTVRTGRHPEN
ncbi:type II toxin-antitoxin system death-on-curing family toxin [Microbacterium sp. BH-3-3-3]|uniref:type II toxin-antitoxin system death-on-curing family toxin n=1 Tax=Microbacterium sp. BH-3-3-3 TaxID=1906742 RepID=UPI0011A72EBE|nr:type II toxin-antitoxin system death-on-curing family toxin [Microbacterium sp. BH-3-3-3]